MNYHDAQSELLQGGNVFTEECSEFRCCHGIATVFHNDGLTGEGVERGGDGDGVFDEVGVGGCFAY